MSTPDLITRKHISAKNFLGLYVGLGLLAAAILWAGFATGLAVSPVLIIAVAFSPLLLGILYTWLMRISTEYRVFQDSLEVESGIIARSIDNIQLFRVRDLGLSQSVLGRLLNVGNILVSSTDQSAPHLVLRGIDEPRGLYEMLRELVAKSQAARRTMIVEEETPGSSA